MAARSRSFKDEHPLGTFLRVSFSCRRVFGVGQGLGAGGAVVGGERERKKTPTRHHHRNESMLPLVFLFCFSFSPHLSLSLNLPLNLTLTDRKAPGRVQQDQRQVPGPHPGERVSLFFDFEKNQAALSRLVCLFSSPPGQTENRARSSSLSLFLSFGPALSTRDGAPVS